MNFLIGEKLDFVLQYLKQNKQDFEVEVVSNNHNVQGDTTLVTNVVVKDKTIILYVGEFIFNLKECNNED